MPRTTVFTTSTDPGDPCSPDTFVDPSGYKRAIDSLRAIFHRQIVKETASR